MSIHGQHDVSELELDHLEGYQGIRQVRVGNEGIMHTQFDLYGAFLDGLYLYNKFAKPIWDDQWLSVRQIVNYIIRVVGEPDMAIWDAELCLLQGHGLALKLADKRSNLSYSNGMNGSVCVIRSTIKSWKKGITTKRNFSA